MVIRFTTDCASWRAGSECLSRAVIAGTVLLTMGALGAPPLCAQNPIPVAAENSKRLQSLVPDGTAKGSMLIAPSGPARSSLPLVTSSSSSAAATSGLQSVTPRPMSLDQASLLSLQQASAFRQAIFDEQAAAMDLLQSRATLLPRVRSASTASINKPLHPGTVDPSFIAQNATREYQQLVGVLGSLDFGVHAAIARNRALLEAAHAGTEIARRALLRGVHQSYFALALANGKRRSAEEALQAAEEFARVTALQNEAGEVPEVDAIRARLVVAQRRDDAELARLQQLAAEAAFRVLIGYGREQPLSVSELTAEGTAEEIERFTADTGRRRPEFAQLEARRRAARAEVNLARAERLPSLTYEVDEGFDSPSLRHNEIRQHSGYLAIANLNIPIFDWGVSRSRQRQAELRAQAAENQAALVERDLNLQFVGAREEALTAIARAGHARMALQDAQRNVEVSIARYRAGEAPILEVTDALTTLAQQRAAREQALYDFEIARSHLREAAGIWDAGTRDAGTRDR